MVLKKSSKTTSLSTGSASTTLEVKISDLSASEKRRFDSMYKEMKKSFNFYNKPFGGNDAFRFVFGIFKRLTKAEKKYSEKKNVMGRTYYFLEFLKGEDGLASIKEDHFLFEFANNLLEMPETALFDIVNNAFGIQFVD